VFQNELKAGSTELTGIFARPVMLANDTSAVVGYAPATDTERLVLSTERHINSVEFQRQFPEAGEDVKVMGYRYDQELLLTLAIAFVDRHVPNVGTYFARKEEIRRAVISDVDRQQHALRNVNVQLNTLDDPKRGQDGLYLTVLGTSAESGDSGQVGRGNKFNGLIALQRPMSTEAVAGKNPVSHVGKLYNLLAGQIAENIYARVPGLAEVNVWLGSQIGRPLDQPAIAAVQLIPHDEMHLDKKATMLVEEAIASELADIASFSARLIRGDISVW
jgi:S-adenosylmethionine synthetase